MKTVIILGGTSHIAKGLISRFLKQPDFRIEWFGRSESRMNDFLQSEHLSGNITLRSDYDSLQRIHADALINCVGAGTPDKLKEDYTLWFTVLEKYDNLCLEYLTKINSDALYINFSSGAVYGHNSGVMEFRADPNRIQVADYYALAKIYSEAKHRANRDLNVVDIRIFSYFSRYADPNSGYLMTDILKAVLNKDVLKTTDSDLIRDYISPDDLFTLVCRCLAAGKLNTAMDAFSGSPVSKQEILAAFQKRFDLKIEVSSSLSAGKSPNATVSAYIPQGRSAGKLGYIPEHSSLDGLLMETEAACRKTQRNPKVK